LVESEDDVVGVAGLSDVVSINAYHMLLLLRVTVYCYYLGLEIAIFASRERDRDIVAIFWCNGSMRIVVYCCIII